MNSNVNVAAPAFSFQELSRALGNVDPQTTQLVMSGVGILQQKVQETEELRAKVAVSTLVRFVMDARQCQAHATPSAGIRTSGYIDM